MEDCFDGVEPVEFRFSGDDVVFGFFSCRGSIGGEFDLGCGVSLGQGGIQGPAKFITNKLAGCASRDGSKLINLGPWSLFLSKHGP